MKIQEKKFGKQNLRKKIGEKFWEQKFRSKKLKSKFGRQNF